MNTTESPHSGVNDTYKSSLSGLGIDLSAYENDNFTASLMKDLKDAGDFSKTILLSLFIPLALSVSVALAYGILKRVWLFPIALFAATLPIAIGSGLFGLSRALRKAVVSLNGLVLKSFNVMDEIRENARKNGKKAKLSEICGFVGFFVILPIVARWARKLVLGRIFVSILKKAFRKTVAALERDRQKVPSASEAMAPEGKPVSEKLRIIASRTAKIVNGAVWTVATVCVFLGISAVSLGAILVSLALFWGFRPS